MKKLIAGLLIAVASFASPVFASDITVTQAIELDAAEAVNKVFHVQLADNGVLVLAVKGNDRFSRVIENATHVSAEIDHKTAYVKFGTTGQFAIGASTICGVAFSVVVDVYSQKQPKPLLTSLPKAVINAPEKCVL